MWAAKVNRIYCTSAHFIHVSRSLKQKQGTQLATKAHSQRPWSMAQLQTDTNSLLKKSTWRSSCIILQAEEGTDSLSQYLLNLLGQIQLSRQKQLRCCFTAARGPGHENNRQQPLLPERFSCRVPDH